MGGYALDGINVPICTDGPFNCMHKAIEGASSTDIIAQGLFAIVGNKKPVFTRKVLHDLASFLRP